MEASLVGTLDPWTRGLLGPNSQPATHSTPSIMERKEGVETYAYTFIYVGDCFLNKPYNKVLGAAQFTRLEIHLIVSTLHFNLSKVLGFVIYICCVNIKRHQNHIKSENVYSIVYCTVHYIQGLFYQWSENNCLLLLKYVSQYLLESIGGSLDGIHLIKDAS